ncbi:MAG: nuclear transport factor 2 family protein [Nitrospirota bacterium]|nr:nuclear transport factor 2 family protein [Nitrospirota bacterium]
MTPLQLARTYMDIIFSGQRPERLADILTDDFQFSGPLYQFGSAAEYIEAMGGNPLAGCGYAITSEFENADGACLIYTFTKPGIKARMAQTFSVRDGRVARVELLFDARPFV